MSKLIAATGHRLTLDLERTDTAVRGLPNTPLSRRLRQHRRALLAAVAAAGGRNLRVFGSVARGEDGPSSDVDLLVDLPAGTAVRVRLLQIGEAIKALPAPLLESEPQTGGDRHCAHA